MLNFLTTITDYKTPLLGTLSLFFGGLILVSPLGTGLSEQYGFPADQIPPSIQLALRDIQSNPDDPPIVFNAADVLITQGRIAGNSEIVAVADTILAAMSETANNPRALKLRAVATQYLHDFDKALALLDQSLAIDKLDPSAILTRANILLVQGKLSAAKAACRSLVRAQRFDLFMLCDTSAKAIGPEATISAQRLSDFVELGRMDSALEGYAYSVLGEIAMFQGDNIEAQRLLEKAQMLDTTNLRIRMIHADSLLNLGRPEDAIEVLNVPANTDSLLVRRALAYKRAGKKRTLARASKEMELLIQGNLNAGHTAHAREEALYFLEVSNDYPEALKRANINWQLQREFEDARLLLDSAKAANALSEAEKVRTWMRDENVTAPELVSRLEALGLGLESTNKR